MEYLTWCTDLLRTIDAAEKAGQAQPYIGVNTDTIASTLFGDLVVGSTWHTSPQRQGLLAMLRELEGVGLLKSTGHGIAYSLNPAGRTYLADPIRSWEPVCAIPLEPMQEQLLRTAITACVREAADHVSVSAVGHADVLTQLAWEDGVPQLLATSQELRDMGVLRISTLVGGPFFTIEPTIAGVIWATRRGYVFESRRIDALVDEWETTSVDFKREVHTGTKPEKAELIKDLVALANTQTSGSRLLVIGFDPKTHAYYGAPDSRLHQDHLEQIVAAYTEPVLDLRYRVIDYREGPVGEIEVLRDRRKLPYRVKQDLGDEKRKVRAGDIFVRHGSLVERPSDGELAAIEEEGSRARVADQP